MTLPWEIFQSAMFFVSACFTGMHAFLFLYFPKKLKRTFSLTGNLQKLYFTLSDSGGLSFFFLLLLPPSVIFPQTGRVLHRQQNLFFLSRAQRGRETPLPLFLRMEKMRNCWRNSNLEVSLLRMWGCSPSDDARASTMA